MDDAVEADGIGDFISFFLEANKTLLFASHAWSTISTHTYKTSVLSSTAMLKQGAVRRSANSWSRMSFPMSSIRLIIVESDSCNPFIYLKMASLLSKSANSISAEAKKQSFTISESEKGFLARAKIHAISQDASVKRSAVEVVRWIRFCCSQSEAVSCAIFFFLSSLPDG